jgi:hypothetical protein
MSRLVSHPVASCVQHNTDEMVLVKAQFAAVQASIRQTSFQQVQRPSSPVRCPSDSSDPLSCPALLSQVSQLVGTVWGGVCSSCGYVVSWIADTSYAFFANVASVFVYLWDHTCYGFGDFTSSCSALFYGFFSGVSNGFGYLGSCLSAVASAAGSCQLVSVERAWDGGERG